MPGSWAARIRARHERFSPIFGDKMKHGIFPISRIGGKINSREELLKHSAGKYRHFEMRRLSPSRAGDASRTDGLELALAVLIRAHAAKAAPERISDVRR